MAGVQLRTVKTSAESKVGKAAPISNAHATKASTKTALYQSGYIALKGGGYEIIADNPSVKRALSELPAYESTLVQIKGHVMKGSQEPQYVVTSIKALRESEQLKEIPGQVTKTGGKYFAVRDGKKTELKPMTENAKDLLASAAGIKNSIVRGAKKGSVVEVWEVILPSITRP